MGYRTVLVLSGGTQRSDLQNFAYCPGEVMESVAELADRTRELEEIFPPLVLRSDDTPHDLQEWIAQHA
jgi:NagD protein